MGINTFPNVSYDWSAYTQHRKQRTIDLTANVYSELLNVTGKGYLAFCFAFAASGTIYLQIYIDGVQISWNTSTPYSTIGIIPLMPSSDTLKVMAGGSGGNLNVEGYDYSIDTSSSLDRTLYIPLFFNDSCIINISNSVSGTTNYSYNVGVIA